MLNRERTDVAASFKQVINVVGTAVTGIACSAVPSYYHFSTVNYHNNTSTMICTSSALSEICQSHLQDRGFKQ